MGSEEKTNSQNRDACLLDQGLQVKDPQGLAGHLQSPTKAPIRESSLLTSAKSEEC